MNVGALWAQMGLDIQLLKAGAAAAKQELNFLESTTAKFSSAVNWALKGAFAGVSVAAFTSEVMKSINVLDQFKVSIIQIAAQIATMQGPDKVSEHYAQAKIYAGQLVEKLKEVDDQSFANNDLLMAMAQTMTLQGVIMDTNNKKQVDSFTALSNAIAMYTVGQNQQIQAHQEIRALMSGETNQGSMLAKQIDDMAKRSGHYKNGLKDIVRLGKEHRDTLERLQPFLAGIIAAAPDIQNTWQAVTSSFQTMVGVLRKKVFADVYETIVKYGSQAVSYMKKHGDSIANTLKNIMDVMVTGAKVATVYFAVFVAAPAIINLASVALARFQVQMALASMEMGKCTIVARMWAFVVGTQTVQAAWAAAGAMSRLAMVTKTLFAFFVGWEIGKYLSEQFETVRLLGVALAAGLDKLFTRIVYGWAAASKALKGDFSGAKQIWEYGSAEVKRKDDFYAQSFYEQTNEQMNKKPAGPVATVPKIPAAPPATSKDKGLKQLEDARLAYLQAVADKELAILKNTNAEKLAIMNSLNTQGLVSTKTYLDEKYALETASIQAEIDKLKKSVEERQAVVDKLQSKKGKQAEIYQEKTKVEQNLTKIADLEEQLKEKRIAYNDEVRKSVEELESTYVGMQAQVADTIGKYEEAARLKVQQQKDTPQRRAIETAATVDGNERAKALKAELDRMDELTIAKGKQQDLDKAMAVALADYETRLAVISSKEQEYELSTADASNQRIAIYQSELVLLKERQKQQETFTADGVTAYQALAAQIQQVNEKLLEQQRVAREQSASLQLGMIYGLKEYQKQLLTMYQQGQTVVTRIANEMESTFSNFFDNILQGKIDSATDAFKAFGDAVVKIFADMLAKMTMASIMGESDKGLASFIKTGIGLVGSLFGGGGGAVGDDFWALEGYVEPSAKGNIYSSPSLSAYSNKVVSEPTVFQFAKGTGLMGEAGSEAIMPLARTSTGDLGVKVAGNTQEINISVPINLEGYNKLSAELRENVERVVYETIERHS